MDNREDDKFKVRNISSTTYVPHLLIEDIIDDVSYSDEDIDWMEEFLIGKNTKQISGDPKKMKNVEEIK